MKKRTPMLAICILMSAQAFAVDPPDLIENPWLPKVTLTGGSDSPAAPQLPEPVVPPSKLILTNLTAGGEGALPWEPTFPDPRPKNVKITFEDTPPNPIPVPGTTPFPGPAWPKAIKVSELDQQSENISINLYTDVPAIIEAVLHIESRTSVEKAALLEKMNEREFKRVQGVLISVANAGYIDKASSEELLGIMDSWIEK